MLHAAEQAGHLDARLGSRTHGQDRHVAHGAAPDPSPAGDGVRPPSSIGSSATVVQGSSLVRATAVRVRAAQAA